MAPPTGRSVMADDVDWSAVADGAHREWVDGEREDEINSLKREIQRLNEVLDQVQDYVDKIEFTGKWVNASELDAEKNNIYSDLANILDANR